MAENQVAESRWQKPSLTIACVLSSGGRPSGGAAGVGQYAVRGQVPVPPTAAGQSRHCAAGTLVIQGRCPTECCTLLKGLSVGCCTSCQEQRGDCGERICGFAKSRVDVEPVGRSVHGLRSSTSGHSKFFLALPALQPSYSRMQVVKAYLYSEDWFRNWGTHALDAYRDGRYRSTVRFPEQANGVQRDWNAVSLPFTGCECRVSSCGQPLLARQLPQARSSNTALLDIA